MKRLLFVIDSLNCGGAEKSLTSLLGQMNFEKYSVDLLMISPEGVYIKSLPPEVNILKSPEFYMKQNVSIQILLRNLQFKELMTRLKVSITLRLPNNKKNFHSSQVFWKTVSDKINKMNEYYDVAIAYSQGTPTYFVAEKVNAGKKICWINTDYKLARYNKIYDKDYYEKYNFIVAVSEYNKNVFINEFPSFQNKTKVIYDIISPKLIRDLSNQSVGYSDNFDGMRVLTVGRLVKAKGYDLAIESCRKLKDMGIRLKWYVIGEGALRREIEKKIIELELEDNFVLLGEKENPYPFIKNCDIYVQPSKFEGFGIAIAEARVLNKPIIATDFSVVHNQIKHNVNGIIVNMDSEKISNAIIELVENKNLNKRLRRNLLGEELGNESEVHKLYSLVK